MTRTVTLTLCTLSRDTLPIYVHCHVIHCPYMDINMYTRAVACSNVQAAHCCQLKKSTSRDLEYMITCFSRDFSRGKSGLPIGQ